MDSQFCKKIEPLLDAFHDGELNASEHQLVVKHLEGCADCCAKLAEIKHVSNGLAKLTRLSLNKDIASEIEKKVALRAAGAGARHDTSVVFLRRQSVLALLAMAACIAMTLFAYQFFTRRAVTVSVAPVELIKPLQLHKDDRQDKDDVALNVANENRHAVQPIVRTQAAFPKNRVAAKDAYGDDAENMVAYYDGNQPSVMEGMGLATDEDGLYALKM